MNTFNRTLLDYFLVFFLAAFLFWPLPPLKDVKEKPNKLEEKSIPSDYFFLQHAFPDDQPDLKAYTSAMKNVKVQMNSRSAALPGFDHAWTLRGPGDAGARVNAIAIHPTNPAIIIAGYSAGGIFKTIDGGVNWYPVFDDQPYLAIGDIQFDPNDPTIVYAGTGDPNITSYPFIGDGVYKSNDGGETWSQIGLQSQGIISKLAIDPTNSDIIYAGTMGLPFAKSNDRGLYKTTDGGASWSQVLFLSDSTGVIDILLNPDNPSVLYAAGWDRIRNNSQSIIYGEGAKIHKSTDGGQTWTVLGGGLPTGPLSRIGLAMSGNNSDHVFALYVGLDFNVHGLYKSVDAGQNWSTLNTDPSSGLFSNALGGFGWYFGKLRVDPNNETNIYILGVQLWASNSGGNSWFMISQVGAVTPHVDHHALAFSSNGDIISGNDGGMYRMVAGTNAWEDIENIPATQFYRTAYNPHEPDAYYGGTQDNGTQKGLRGEAVDWDMIFGGDGFQTVFHPTNPDVFYVETQNGQIWATDNGGAGFQYGSTGLSPNEPKGWDMQYIISPHNPDILYTGTDRLYISTAGAIPNWVPISGVLSAPDGISLPRYHIITTLSESPMDSALIYVGTSDAKVQRKNPATNTWTDISAGLPVRYVTDVVASPDQANVVFVAHSGYKDGEFIPHLHRSDNRGDTWIDISGDLPQLGVNDLFVMPNYNGQVVFAATDAGLYATLDGGSHWERLGAGMPLVPVYDIAYNDTYNEIVAATHARSIFSFPLDTIGVSNMPVQVNLSGVILNEDNEPINAVDISGGQATTMSDGTYTLNTISGSGCSIIPVKNTGVRNGVSIADLVLLQRKLLFITEFDSPYKLIAADVNNSGEISVGDLVLLQRMLLFIDNEFPNNTSWRFIDASFSFNDPLDPFAEDFPETYDCSTSSGSTTNVDFVGLKVGDVDGTATTNFHTGDPDDFSNMLYLNFSDKVLGEGEELELVLKIDIADQLWGIQLDLAYDPTELEILSVKGGSMDHPLAGNLGVNSTADGKQLLVWSSNDGGLPAGAHDFLTLEVRAKKKTLLSEALSLGDLILPQAIFEQGGDLKTAFVELNGSIATDINNEILNSPNAIDIYPNPFNGSGEITIDLSNYEAVTSITLFAVNGQNVISVPLETNQSIYTIQGSELPGLGMYYLRVKSKSQDTVVPLIYQ